MDAEKHPFQNSSFRHFAGLARSAKRPVPDVRAALPLLPVGGPLPPLPPLQPAPPLPVLPSPSLTAPPAAAAGRRAGQPPIRGLTRQGQERQQQQPPAVQPASVPLHLQLRQHEEEEEGLLLQLFLVEARPARPGARRAPPRARPRPGRLRARPQVEPGVPAARRPRRPGPARPPGAPPQLGPLPPRPHARAQRHVQQELREGRGGGGGGGGLRTSNVEGNLNNSVHTSQAQQLFY